MLGKVNPGFLCGGAVLFVLFVFAASATTDKLYATDETEKARAALDDVASFSEQARDNSIQSRKRQKQTEIAVRKMVRKLADIKRAVSHEEQVPVQAAIDRLQRVRDDL